MQPEDFDNGIESDVELYEDDVQAINRVVTAMSSSIGQHRNLETYRQEVINRFGEIGFEVRVVFYEAQYEGKTDTFIMPQVTITARVEAEVLHDHDRHAFQVQAAESARPTKVAMGSQDTRGSAFFKTKSGLVLPNSAK